MTVAKNTMINRYFSHNIVDGHLSNSMYTQEPTKTTNTTAVIATTPPLQ